MPAGAATAPGPRAGASGARLALGAPGAAGAAAPPPRPALPYPAPLWRRHRRAALSYWLAPGARSAPRPLPLAATREGGAPARPLRAPPAAPRGGSAARQALGAGEERAGIPGNSRDNGNDGNDGKGGNRGSGRERGQRGYPGWACSGRLGVAARAWNGGTGAVGIWEFGNASWECGNAGWESAGIRDIGWGVQESRLWDSGIWDLEFLEFPEDFPGILKRFLGIR